MVGEIRDKETAEIAINASLTGHLVLSTLHTNDAAGADTRLIDMGVEPFLVASSVLGNHCAATDSPGLHEMPGSPHPDRFRDERAWHDQAPARREDLRATGCPSCSQSGYSGRTVIHELMVVDDKIRGLIIKNADCGNDQKGRHRSRA